MRGNYSFGMVKKSEDILKKQKRLVKEATAYVKPFRKDLKQYEDFYDGKQWPFGQNRPVRNEILKIIETEVPILTDSSPGIDILAEQEGREQDAELLQSAIHNVFDFNNVDSLLEEVVRSSLVSWSGWLYPDFDPDAAHGDGEIIIKILPWRQVLVDPTAVSIDKANYAIMQVPTKIDEIKRRFGAKAKDIKPQRITMTEQGDILDKSQTESFDSNFFGESEQEGNKFNLDNMAILEETWLRDYSTIPIPEEETLAEIQAENEELMNGINPRANRYENHEAHLEGHAVQLIQILSQALQVPTSEITQEDIEALKQDEMLGVLIEIHQDHAKTHELLFEENPKAEKPKYATNWRVLINVGEIILYDGAPEVLDGMIPLVNVHAYKNGTWHGFGEVKNIIEIQKTLNENRYAMLQGLRLMSNPIWIRDEDSGVPADQINNEPGAVYTKKRGTELRRESGVPVSADLVRQVEQDAVVMGAISGLNEATQGVSPGASASGRQTRILRDQAVGRIRLKSRHIIDSMDRLGQLTASRIVQYYPPEKMLRTKSDTGDVQFQRFDPERVQDLKYFVNVVPGTTAGIDKEVIEAEARALLDGGQIDFKEFLAISSLPFKDTLLKSRAEKDELAQALQELEQGNQQLEQDNLVLRAKLSPETLSNEEIKILEEMQRQEVNEQLTQLQGEEQNA
jgi:hypothetical protein